MDDEQIPHAPAPLQPEEGVPSAPDPVPLPLPTSVTGVSLPTLHIPGGAPWVIAGAVALAFVCTAGYLTIGSFLVGYANAPVTTLSVPTPSGIASDITQDPASDPGVSGPGSPVPDAPQAANETNPDGSLVDTATAVAETWPGFEWVGAATSAGGDPWVVAGWKADPSFRFATDPIFIAMPDPSDDTIQLFGTQNVRGKAFIAYWTAHHPGTVIDSLLAQWDVAGSRTLMDVTYVRSAAEVDDMAHDQWVTLKWDPKKKTWSKQ